MKQLIGSFRNTTEYTSLQKAIAGKQTAAVTGIGQINRSHLIAALHHECDDPIVVICNDDTVAKRLQEDLKAFLHEDINSLPGKELTFYDASVVSRGWEQKRLRQLYALSNGQTRLQILTWNALCKRTIPVDILKQASFEMKIGEEYQMDDLISRLTSAGYSRCGMVEGPGQFAVRGGIIDIYSPAAEHPFRAEFFGDRTGEWKLQDFDINLLARKNFIPITAVYRKIEWEKAGGYCEEIIAREDWEFWISVLKNGGKVVKLPQVLLFYRFRQNSKRVSDRKLKHHVIDTLNKRHPEFFERYLGGPLRYNRSWSRVINRLTRWFR